MWLFLGKKKFARKTDFSRLPKSLMLFNISRTNLEGDVYVHEEVLEEGSFGVTNSGMVLHIYQADYFESK